MKIQLTNKLDQRLSMSQQLVQAIELLQLPTVELEQTIKQFLETNPFIELEEENAPTESENDSDDQSQYNHFDVIKPSTNNTDYEAMNNVPCQATLKTHLLNQLLLCKFNQRDHSIAESIIDAIDDAGFLTMSDEEIMRASGGAAANLDVSDIQRIINTIQTFTPEGVGARTVQECLLIQLESRGVDSDVHRLAKKIIEHYFSELIQNNFRLLSKNLRVSDEQLQLAINLIKSLTPRPGSQYSDSYDLRNDPELYVIRKNNSWKVELTKNYSTNIKLNSYYGDLLKSTRDGGSYDAAKAEYQEAQWLYRAIARRNETLIKVATCIFKYQHEFLDKGKSYLKPMNIVDISSELGMHESTVSRATNGKYIITPHGVFELKFFLPSYVTTNVGENCSAVSVKCLIEDIINSEDRHTVLSDEGIATLLKERGINISRRTVAKYRESLKILPSYQRANAL